MGQGCLLLSPPCRFSVCFCPTWHMLEQGLWKLVTLPGHNTPIFQLFEPREELSGWCQL